MAWGTPVPGGVIGDAKVTLPLLPGQAPQIQGAIGWYTKPDEPNSWYYVFPEGYSPAGGYQVVPQAPSGGGSSGGGIGSGPSVGSSGFSGLGGASVGGGVSGGVPAGQYSPDDIAQQNEAMRNQIAQGLTDVQGTNQFYGGGTVPGGGGDGGGGFDPAANSYGSGSGSMYDYSGMPGTVDPSSGREVLGYDDSFNPVYGPSPYGPSGFGAGDRYYSPGPAESYTPPPSYGPIAAPPSETQPQTAYYPQNNPPPSVFNTGTSPISNIDANAQMDMGRAQQAIDIALFGTGRSRIIGFDDSFNPVYGPPDATPSGSSFGDRFPSSLPPASGSQPQPTLPFNPPGGYIIQNAPDTLAPADRGPQASSQQGDPIGYDDYFQPVYGPPTQTASLSPTPPTPPLNTSGSGPTSNPPAPIEPMLSPTGTSPYTPPAPINPLQQSGGGNATVAWDGTPLYFGG